MQRCGGKTVIAGGGGTTVGVPVPVAVVDFVDADVDVDVDVDVDDVVRTVTGKVPRQQRKRKRTGEVDSTSYRGRQNSIRPQRRPEAMNFDQYQKFSQILTFARDSTSLFSAR